MILADTSAWVEYDRATGTAVHRRVVELITTEVDLAVTEPVIVEVLAGARNEQRQLDLRRLLLRFTLLRFDAASDFDSAARMDNRRLSANGTRSSGCPPGCSVCASAGRS